MSSENQVQWSMWLEELPLLGQFKVERCLVPASVGKLVKCQSIKSSDASMSAYGSVSYLHAVNVEGIKARNGCINHDVLYWRFISTYC